MTTALTEDLIEELANKARTVGEGVEGVAEGIEALNTNVFVVIAFEGPFVKTVYGPFRSRYAAKDWGLINVTSFTIMEIMRPRDVEEVGFVLPLTPAEPTLEDQGIHPDQSQIGDYIDPNVVR